MIRFEILMIQIDSSRLSLLDVIPFGQAKSIDFHLGQKNEFAVDIRARFHHQISKPK